MYEMPPDWDKLNFAASVAPCLHSGELSYTALMAVVFLAMSVGSTWIDLGDGEGLLERLVLQADGKQPPQPQLTGYRVYRVTGNVEDATDILTKTPLPKA